MPHHTHTLTGHEYLSDEVWHAERRRIFHGGWFLADVGQRLQRGNRTVVDIAGESVLITRDLDGVLHAFANVCRHRGARLCDAHSDSGQGSLMCPYHAWTYALSGQLIATPHLGDDDVDRSTLPLWAYHLREWQGLVFVSLAADPPDFDEWIRVHCPSLLPLERFHLADLAVAATVACDVHANWKIVLENYQECLHCTRVHPELVDLVPFYRSGWVWDRSRSDGGVALSRGNTMSREPLDLPPLQSDRDTDNGSYFGGMAFPNAFLDITGPCAVVSVLQPKSPHLTTMTMHFLFDPATMALPGFDPAPIVDFNVLVADQDNVVCERVHQGVGSMAFDHGVLSPKDDLVIELTQHYRSIMGSD